jgi:hypothetical protein
MPAFREEFQRELDDMRRQSVSDWKERYLRVEEPLPTKTKEQIEAEEAEINRVRVQNYNAWAHENPEEHFKRLEEELQKEYFCRANRMEFTPSVVNGLPGYWAYRLENLPAFAHNDRKRLPNE